uniref:Uncharacterized protein n=1 Tax=Anopheles atroparvus TaxID=41427 RepID=A0AAG5DQ16_ANOAO
MSRGNRHHIMPIDFGTTSPRLAKSIVLMNPSKRGFSPEEPQKVHWPAERLKSK